MTLRRQDGQDGALTVLRLDELPEVDFIVVSHDHFDHLDMDSVKYFRDKSTKFITPLGIGSHLQGWGIPADRIVERDWWESVAIGDIEFTATPAQHFSGRYSTSNESLWASWVVKSKNHSIFYSGDSGYGPHFQEIGEKYGGFDVAFLECGQYDKDWAEIHMFPQESVAAFKDLRAKKFFPVHWGMYQTAYHTWSDPIERLDNLSRTKGFALLTPKLGQIADVEKDTFREKWWRN